MVSLSQRILGESLEGERAATRRPGRLVGRKMMLRDGVRVILSAFEITNASDIQSLRIVLYEMEHCQTCEVRLSDLEKLMLFNDMSPLIDQIEERIRTVYCDTTAGGRNVIKFRQDFEPIMFPDYVVEDEEEYDILDYKELRESRMHADSDGDEGQKVSAPARISGSPAFRSRGGRVQLREGSGVTNQILTDDLLASYREAVISDDEDDDDEDSTCYDADSDDVKSWNWAFYFNRALSDELLGNLSISISLNLNRRGFDFYVLDVRSLRETYVFVSYQNILPYFYGKTMEQLERMLQTVDENSGAAVHR